MQTKKLLPLLLALIMIFAAACSKAPAPTPTPAQTETPAAQVQQTQNPNSIIIVQDRKPETLSPMYGTDTVTKTIINAIYAPLFLINDGKYDYYLAESLTPSQDMLSYTLKLKPNLKWHDGKDITADDIVYTVEKALDSKSESFMQGLFMIGQKAVQVSKIDNLTVKFTLPEIDPVFPQILSEFTPVAKHIYETVPNISKNEYNNKPIGSGPYKFKEASEETGVVVVPFENYFGGKPKVESLAFKVVSAKDAETVLEKGGAQIKYLAPTEVEKYTKDSSLNLLTQPDNALFCIAFNLNTDLMKNKDLRQAVAYAINREEVAKAAYPAKQSTDPAYSIFTPNALGYTQDVNHFDNNIEKAKSLVQKSGVASPKLKLAYIFDSKEQKAQAAIVQNNLKAAGIEVALVPIEKGIFYKKVFDRELKEFDLSFNGYGMDPDPRSIEFLYMGNQMYNLTRYNNPEVDDLWIKADNTTDKAKKIAIYKTIQQKIVDDMVVLPISYPKSILAINKKVGGIEEAKPITGIMFQDWSKLYINK